jgi:hypothetical protein
MVALPAIVAAQSAVAPSLRLIPITGLPEGSSTQGYGVYEGRAGTLLAVEQRTADGTVAFYTFDSLPEGMQARVLGARSLPGEILPPPEHQPTDRRIDGVTGRYWLADSTYAPEQAAMLVSAPRLEALLGTPVSGSPWQLSPPPESPLALRRIVLTASGAVRSNCILEVNITAVQDRVTTFGAWWVEAFGEPHLLVGLVQAEPMAGANGGFRLYNEQMEVVSELTGVVSVDRNRYPDILQLDVTQDGMPEIVVISSAPNPETPLAVIELVRHNGPPVFGFHLCTVRANGPDVVRLQRLLEQRGYSVGPSGLDGWYGPDTRAAVIRFQRDEGLPVTGMVTATVWNALGVNTVEGQ